MNNRVRVSRMVNAPIDRVWEIITDLDSAANTLSGVSRIEKLTEGPYRPGTRWRETRTMMGREATEEMWVEDAERPRRTTVCASSRGVDYRTVIELQAHAETTELSMDFSASEAPQPGRDRSAFGKAVSRVLAPLGAALTKRMLTKDLDDIAQAAERG